MTAMTYFQLCAQDNIWAMIAPEMVLACMGLLLLGLEFFLPKQAVLPMLRLLTFGVLGFLLAFITYKYCFIPSVGRSFGFSGLILQTGYTDVFRLFFLLNGILTAHLATRYFEANPDLNPRAFYPLLLWVVAAFMLLVQTQHFAAFFVMLEAVTVGFYLLIAYNSKREPSLEAALKYLVLGALTSPILLMGIALLYGIAGNPNMPAYVMDGMSFSALHVFISANPTHPFVLLGAAFVLIAVAFKIGAFPLQIWIPDVYQGAPLPITALLAVASKAAGIILLMHLLHGPFAALQGTFLPILLAVAIATILFGNITALPQENTKRLIGLSGISHAGYLLLGVLASFSIDWAAQAILFYLFVYLIASYAVLGVMGYVSKSSDYNQTIHDYTQLAERDGFLSFVLVVGLASLAGIPPLAGFVAKFLLLLATYQAELYWGLGAALLGVVISIYYYFTWMRSAVFRPWSTEKQIPSEGRVSFAGSKNKWVLGVLTALSLVLGFIPAVILLL